MPLSTPVYWSTKHSYFIWLHTPTAPFHATPVPREAPPASLRPTPPSSRLLLVYILCLGRPLKPKTTAFLRAFLPCDRDGQAALTFSSWVVLGFVATAWICFSFSSLFTCCRNGSNAEIKNVRTFAGSGRHVLVFPCEGHAVLHVNSTLSPSTFLILSPSSELASFRQVHFPKAFL